MYMQKNIARNQFKGSCQEPVQDSLHILLEIPVLVHVICISLKSVVSILLAVYKVRDMWVTTMVNIVSYDLRLF